MRAPAQSLNEICTRHSCVQSMAVTDTMPTDLSPYDTIIIRSAYGPIGPSLTPSLDNIRSGNFEISEIYTRRGEAPFEPLVSSHLSLDGSWVAVARKRHPSNEPRIVGIMLAKDEADIMPNVITDLSKSLDRLYYFAGDAATEAAIVRNAPNKGWAGGIPDPNMPHADGLRHFLLEQARKDALTDNDPRPMWVMVVQGDEIYHDDLRHHVLLAQTERATVMTCQVATFLLHESQKTGWNWEQSLATRFTHYIWDFGEHSGFLDFPWIYYTPSEHMRAHPHGIYPAKWASARPVRKHYPFRSPGQAQARIQDRLKATTTHPHGWQPHYNNYANVFVGDTAAGRPLKRYFGWFPEAERVEGIW